MNNGNENAQLILVKRKWKSQTLNFREEFPRSQEDSDEDMSEFGVNVKSVLMWEEELREL